MEKKKRERGDEPESNDNYGYLRIIYESSVEQDSLHGVDIKQDGSITLMGSQERDDNNTLPHESNSRQNRPQNVNIRHQHNTHDKHDSEYLHLLNEHASSKDKRSYTKKFRAKDRKMGSGSGFENSKDSSISEKCSSSKRSRGNKWKESSGSGFNSMNCFKSEDTTDTDYDEEDDYNDAFQQKHRNCSLKQAAVTKFSLKSDDTRLGTSGYTDINSNIGSDQAASQYSQTSSIQDWSSTSETYSYRKFRKFDPVTIGHEIVRLDVEKLGFVYVEDISGPAVTEEMMASFKATSQKRTFFCIIL